MSYSIEFGQDVGSAFYAEFLLVDQIDGSPIDGTGIDHQFNVLGWREDYGCWGLYGTTLASNSNGLITTPAPGVLAIAIPPSRFFGSTDPETGVWLGGFQMRRRSLRFTLQAVPANPDFASTLATGTISFGDRSMPSPRIQLGVYPLYPNSLTQVLTPSQWLRALSASVPNGRAQLDAAISSSPDDANRIIYDTSRDVSPGGAFETMASALLGLAPATVATIRVLAATLSA